jgi:hypothetical protein
MTENKYEIIFRDKQTHQEYKVNLTVNGELAQAALTGPISNVKVNRLEDQVVKMSVEVKLE